MHIIIIIITISLTDAISNPVSGHIHSYLVDSLYGALDKSQKIISFM